MSHSFKVGDLVEFLGCELTRMDPCKNVRVSSLKNLENGRVSLEFQEGHPHRFDGPLKGTLVQVVNISSVKPLTTTKGISTMSLKITTSHKVQNQETKDLNACTQAKMISEQQTYIETLEKVKPKTKKITATITELKQDLKLFIEHLDSLEQ